MRLAPDVDFRLLARRTPGYVGADLTAISKVRSIRWVCGWLSLTSVAPRSVTTGGGHSCGEACICGGSV